MASTVGEYLAELRTHLAGEDPALIQDALYDAEEYLLSAMAEGSEAPQAFEQIANAYGTPAEIADAYRETELTVARALKRPEPVKSRGFWATFFGVAVDAETYGSLFYMLISMATGIVYFTVVVTGLSLSVGLMITLLGIPLALLLIAVVRAVSLAEGRMVEGLLGERMPRRPRSVGQQGDIWERLKSWFTDYRTWTTMLYMVLQMPLGILYFTAAVVGITVPLSIVALPVAQLVLDTPLIRDGQYGYLIDTWAMPFVMAGGVALLFGSLWVIRGIGKLHGMYAKVMLVGRFTGADDAS